MTENKLFEISKKKQIIDIRVPLVKNKDWEQWVFCTGDQHFDIITPS